MSWPEHVNQQRNWRKDNEGQCDNTCRSHDGPENQDRPRVNQGRTFPGFGRGNISGRDIGMYYRDRNIKKNKMYIEHPQTVSLDASKKREISQRLGLDQDGLNIKQEPIVNVKSKNVEPLQNFQEDHRRRAPMKVEEERLANGTMTGISRGRNFGGAGRGSHPPGLSGREIGMYYRNRIIMRNKMNEECPQTVSLDARKEHEISQGLGLDKKRLNIKQESVANIKGRKEEPLQDFQDHHQTIAPIKEEVDWWANVSSDDGVSTAASCSRQSDGKRSVTSFDEFTAVQRKKIGKIDSELPLNHEQRSCDNNGKIKLKPEIDDIQNIAADKYSHLKDSHFKRKFLQNITGNIESNLEQSISKKSPLIQNEQLDKILKDSLLLKQQSNEIYKKMLQFRMKLPAYEKRHNILDLIEKNQVVVISGETGCGKTTQVGQFILDDFILQGKGSMCHIVCTQPRRISATSVAQRVADERAEVLGAESTGFQIRLEKKIPRPQGSMVFCTTGVMIQWMLSDPGLISISHLILDEIHERDVTSDFVITLLKSIIPQRPDLKLILMSATLNSEQFSKYYDNCPSINIPGFTYPVKEYYLEDALQVTNYGFPKSKPQRVKVWHKYLKHARTIEDPSFDHFVLPYVRQLESENNYSRNTLENLRNPESEKINIEFITTLIHHICTTTQDGAILVFLPGWSDISKLHSELANAKHFSSSRYLIIPLHSMMPTAIQKSIFDRPKPGVRKIVIATNIAETSITIEDVVFVIDCGKIKMTNFDVKNNIATMKSEWVSLANAKQRRGRAGRVQDGVCYHLYSKGREMTLESYPLPEMLRTRLEQVILQIKMLQIGLATPFLERVMNPPNERAINLSLQMLRTLNALDSEENLTPLGFHLAKLPMDPQAGKMILMAAIFGCVDPILSIAAGLNFKDPFLLPLGKEAEVARKKLELAKGSKSDHLVLAAAVSKWERARGSSWGRQFCNEYFLSSGTLQLLSEMKLQLAGYLHEMNFLSSSDPKAREANINSENVNLLKAVICAGLYPNVALIRMKNPCNKYPMVLLHTPEDGKVTMHIRSVNEKITHFESKFLLYHKKLRSSGVFLHDTTMIFPLPLLFFGEGVHFTMKDGHETINVNEHIYFRCQESTANIVKVLRGKLDSILEHKISHPGSIDWNDANEGGILRDIIELITNEDRKMSYNYDDDYDFSD